MEPAYDIAARNIGKNHIGVLAGTSHYAQVLVQLGRYEEAEALFAEHMDKEKYRDITEEDGEHPDRCVALWYLIGCLEKQGRFEEALETCEILVNALRNIGGRGLGMQHKMATMVQDEIAMLKRKIEGNAQAGEMDLQRFTSY